MSLEVSIFKNVRGLNKNWDQFVKQRAFLLFHGFLGVFEANSNKMQLPLQNCVLEIPGVVIVDFFKLPYARK